MSQQQKRKQSPTARSARGSLGYDEDGLDAPGRPNSSSSESSTQQQLKKTSATREATTPARREQSSTTAVEEISTAEPQKAAAANAPPPPATAPAKKRSLPSRIFHAIWATKLTEDLKDSTAKAKTMLRELVIYFIYLIVLTVITLGTYNSNMFRMTDALSAALLNSPFPDFSTNNYYSIGHMGDWVAFFGRTDQTSVGGTRGVQDGPFLAAMYPERYYNEKPLDSGDLGYISFENKLLGVPRVRQVRVGNDSCKINYKSLRNLIDKCYAEFSNSAEDKSSFGPMTSPAWVYSNSTVTKAPVHFGTFGIYGGGGFYTDLPRKRDEAIDAIKNLVNGTTWIDRGTRAIFIDFTVYNANFNLFSIVRLVTEIPAIGGALPSYIIRTVKLLRYETAGDFIIMGFEYAFCIFVAYYIVEEIMEIQKMRLAYFKGFWNLMDIASLILSIVSIAFNFYRTIAIESKLDEVMAEPDSFVDFESLSFWQFQFNYCVAILVFISWVKVFKYLSFNKTMNQMTKTLSAAKKELGGFLVMFFIVFFTFAQVGYLLFGSLVEDYKTIKSCIETLLRILLGDFDYRSLKEARALAGPFYFLCYVLIVLFILFNMFMAILNDAYSEVKSNLINEKNEFEVVDFFRDQYSAVLEKLHLKRDKIVDIQDALRGADHDADKVVSYEEWKRELQGRGYTDDEIHSAFAKYDIDQNGFLDAAEQDSMMADLEAQKNAVHDEMEQVESKIKRPSSSRPITAAAAAASSSSASGGRGKSGGGDDEAAGNASADPAKPRIISEVSFGEFNAVARRIDRLEHSIGSIVSKIDCVLVKLEVMETAKLRRREAMTALLDNLTAGENFSEDERKKQMEKLVKEELERFDSEIVATGRPGSSASRPGTGASRPPTGLRK